MIRDEFKNADKKVIDKKANKKLQEMGERAYYAKKLSLYSEMLKPAKFSTLFCTVLFSIAAILYIVASIVTKEVTTTAIVIFCIEGALIIWCFVWFLFLAPFIRKKTEFYKSEMIRLNTEYVLKTKSK